MRSSWLVTAVVTVLALGVGALDAPAAAAQRVELAGRVTASRTVLSQRRVGEARYIALSDLFYRDRSAVVEVLDLATRSVIQVEARRTALERRFGVSRGGSVAVPQGDVVVYRDGVVGLALASAAVVSPRRYWYAELDAATGKLRRVADLAALRDGEQLEVIGADAEGGAAWFAITRLGAHGRSLVLRRLDLASLEQQDEQRVVLAPRPEGGHEHAVRVHAAADFSRFAVVEYAEDGVGMAPGHIYVVDPVVGTSFSVAAPPAAYGVAFSADGRYVYVGSAQRGTISRIDIAAGRIDKQVAGPRFLHHLVISPSGKKLFALASSTSYAVYDLPDLQPRSDATHPAGVASAMAELHGNGCASLDGAYFVAPEAEDPRKPHGDDRGYVIARLIE
ncbi:MAG TPA: hypothetical protein VHW23_43830 [Kofleriaceae bacterium]|jgi:hypothetical protein|nr:hypothetical protein [Kofleriaceae bacterium]